MNIYKKGSIPKSNKLILEQQTQMLQKTPEITPDIIDAINNAPLDDESLNKVEKKYEELEKSKDELTELIKSLGINIQYQLNTAILSLDSSREVFGRSAILNKTKGEKGPVYNVVIKSPDYDLHIIVSKELIFLQEHLKGDQKDKEPFESEILSGVYDVSEYSEDTLERALELIKYSILTLERLIEQERRRDVGHTIIDIADTDPLGLLNNPQPKESTSV